MSNLIINGRNSPSINTYTAAFQPLNSSAQRNGQGRTLRSPLPDKWKLELTWKFDNPEDGYDWYDFLCTLTKIDIPITFPSPRGTIENAEFYITAPTAIMLDITKGVAGWWRDVKCEFIEV